MLITKIEKQKNNSKRYSIFIDGEFSFGLDDVDLLYYKLKENDEIDKETFEHIFNQIVFEKAKKVAIRYLSYKMRSEYQVIKKLKFEQFPDQIIKKVLGLLKKYNYINDYDFAKAFFKDKTQISKHGIFKVKSELKLCGVKSEIIEKVISENSNQDEQAEVAFNLLVKKTFRKTFDYCDYKQRQKLTDYLLRRGFSFDVAKVALDRFIFEKEFDKGE